MKKIIYISVAPITESLLQRLYVDVLYNAGFDVEFWDILGIFHEKNRSLVHECVIQINTFKELKERIIKIPTDETLINIQVGYEYKYIKLYRLFNNFKISHFYIGVFPNYKKENTSVYQYFIEKIFSSRIFKKPIEILAQKIGFVKSFDYVFSATSEVQNIFSKSKIIRINYIDYEKILEVKVKVRNCERYVLFLDQNLAEHPDFKFLNKAYINKNRYFGELKDFFLYIENYFSLKVIIALHPTSKKYNFWPKDKQYFGDVYRLIEGAEMIIGHYSTSLCSAISAYKPIVLISTSEIQEKIPLALIRINGLHEKLDVAKIHLDKNYCFEEFPKVKKHLYKEFLYSYCTDVSIENKFAKDYLVKYLKEI